LLSLYKKLKQLSFNALIHFTKRLKWSSCYSTYGSDTYKQWLHVWQIDNPSITCHCIILILWQIMFWIVYFLVKKR